MSKIMIGLSGGVDSAVAAYLLKEQGHEVIAGFMRNWDSMANNDFLGNPDYDSQICPQEKDYNDAKKIASQLGIELYRIDFIKEYWNDVFMYFIEEYKKGRTPNPDILCNKYIKFDAFMKFAKSKGAEYIATGHYAIVEHGKISSKMYKGKDDNKDQTYFLCSVSQQQLKQALFPLGNLKKTEVREIAKKLNLDVADKKDSTGVCFIGERNFKEFLKNYIPAKRGDIVDVSSNRVIGNHEGVMYYTIGQRKGLGIGGLKEYSCASWFVVGKDVIKNILYVAQGDENNYLLADKCVVTNMNWIAGAPPLKSFKCQAKFRYRQKDQEVFVNVICDDTIMISCVNPAKAVTSGQAAVLYYDGECLGGGTIDKVYRNEKLLLC